MNPLKRVLVVGVGSIGERHARCFLATGRAEVSICELNPELRRTVAERYSLKQTFDDLPLALADKPDVAVICTPAHLHIPMAQAAAEAGVHVLIEKPLSTRLDGIETLEQRFRSGNLAAGVAYVYRAHPVLTAMRKHCTAVGLASRCSLSPTADSTFPSTDRLIGRFTIRTAPPAAGRCKTL